MTSKFFQLLFLICIIFSLVSCAKRGRPEGGPKDETAPIMITAQPDHLSTNFNEKKNQIKF